MPLDPAPTEYTRRGDSAGVAGAGEPPPPATPARGGGTRLALADAAVRVAIGTLDAELVAIRARLSVVEGAVGGIAHPGAPPPALGELRQRVAALERRAGIVPGLLPLPEHPAGGAAGAAQTIALQEPWPARVQAAFVVAVLVALLVWLLWPGGSPAPASEAPGRQTIPAASATARPMTTPPPPAEPPFPPCAWVSGETCT